MQHVLVSSLTYGKILVVFLHEILHTSWFAVGWGRGCVIWGVGESVHTSWFAVGWGMIYQVGETKSRKT